MFQVRPGVDNSQQREVERACTSVELGKHVEEIHRACVAFVRVTLLIKDPIKSMWVVVKIMVPFI